MSDQLEDGCLCGAVRFVATGQQRWVAWCHCQSCRKHSGAPVSVFVACERAAYTVTNGEIIKFRSSPATRRGFCSSRLLKSGLCACSAAHSLGRINGGKPPLSCVVGRRGQQRPMGNRGTVGHGAGSV